MTASTSQKLVTSQIFIAGSISAGVEERLIPSWREASGPRNTSLGSQENRREKSSRLMHEQGRFGQRVVRSSPASKHSDEMFSMGSRAVASNTSNVVRGGRSTKARSSRR